MKTLQFIFIFLIMAVAVIGQKKSGNTAPAVQGKDTVVSKKSDTLFVNISKVRVIAFVDSTSKVPFKYVDALPIAIYDNVSQPRVYWWQLKDLLLSSKTSLSAKELATYYSPFNQLADQYEMAVKIQEQQQKQKSKQ